MPRIAQPLSAQGVAKRSKPGRIGDGLGLYLFVRSAEQKYWVFRYTRASSTGKMRELGLGPAAGRAAVSLADARKKARALYDMVREGRDPLDERDAGRKARQVEAAKAMTFRECAEAYIEAHAPGWRNAKHAKQWPATLSDYAYPVFGALPVAAIDTALVLKALEPIWKTKTETAGRVRGRIESILNWAKARGYRDGENPAAWRGHLENLLPARRKVRRVEHHPALPYDEIGGFMAALRAQEGVAARALEFAILTAARVGETIGATWGEVDMAEKMWVLAGDRMKAGREHRVPLSARVIDILKGMEPDGKAGGDYVFPGAKPGRPLSGTALLALLERMECSSATVHGFRSTFRDWAAERTNYPSEVAEMALAHAVGDKVEAAYRRGDMLAKRRRFMEEWSRFCSLATQKPKQDKVTALRAKV